MWVSFCQESPHFFYLYLSINWSEPSASSSWLTQTTCITSKTSILLSIMYYLLAFSPNYCSLFLWNSLALVSQLFFYLQPCYSQPCFRFRGQATVFWLLWALHACSASPAIHSGKNKIIFKFEKKSVCVYVCVCNPGIECFTEIKVILCINTSLKYWSPNSKLSWYNAKCEANLI